MSTSAFFLAFIWGGIWSLTIQHVPLVAYLAQKRTWITVVVGIGVDMAIGLLAVQDAPSAFVAWAYQLSVIALSSIGIIARSIINEWRAEKEFIENASQDSR